MSTATTMPPIAPPVSAPPAALRYSVAEYLEMERNAEVRHEYVNGEIIEMAGETPRHNRIAGNFYLKLETAFGDSPCEAYIEGVRLRVSPTQYRYPDVAALCGEAQFDSDNPPALLNPSLIVEVLSPSTQDFDHDEKFMEYRQIASFTDYVLVAQDTMRVVHQARQNATEWRLTEYTQPTDTLMIAALEVSLTLADIYRKITFADS